MSDITPLHSISTHRGNPTSVLPWHADATQSQGQRDVLRPVRHDKNEVGPITDHVGSPATWTNNMASHRKCWVITLNHPTEKTKQNLLIKLSLTWSKFSPCKSPLKPYGWQTHTKVCCGILDNCMMSKHVAEEFLLRTLVHNRVKKTHNVRFKQIISRLFGHRVIYSACLSSKTFPLKQIERLNNQPRTFQIVCNIQIALNQRLQ